MGERSVFDTLVAELSTEERRDLLERITRSSQISEEPLYPPSSLPRAAHADYESRASELGIVARLFLLLRSIFRGKSREELLREDDLRLISASVETAFPGLVDWRRTLLLAPFAAELRRLRDSAKFFYDILDRGIGKDRAAFYAFLASLELADVHRRLLEETEPSQVEARLPEADESELRAAIFAAYEEILASLDDGGRRAMYNHVRSVLFLKRLSGFLFERLLQTFRPGLGPAGSEGASFIEVRDLLLELGDILFSMSAPPRSQLVAALFAVVERDEIGRPGGDPESLLNADMGRAESALERIRMFNSRVPLGNVLKLVASDPDYTPRELAGGEDWLVLYRSFWRERIDHRLDEWRSDRRYRELAEDISRFVGEPGLRHFDHIDREESETSPPIGQDLALSFLDAFHRGPFTRELSRVFKIVLVDGEFYRKDNRLEFTDAYDSLMRVPEAITLFDSRLGADGDIGSTWVQARSDMSPLPIKRRKVQAIARGAEEEAERIVKNTGRALLTMVRVLRGVLKGEAGGRYDSLSNLSYLDGKANRDFLKALSAAKDRCERASSILAELSGLDIDAEE
ncbi:MAG TPA: DUF5312 family protein [Rectinemataceae bacterium]|nr:DUF5312 family protein [Rectinemataceae bacterium]